jgi:hypothetical protein
LVFSELNNPTLTLPEQNERSKNEPLPFLAGQTLISQKKVKKPEACVLKHSTVGKQPPTLTLNTMAINRKKRCCENLPYSESSLRILNMKMTI